MHLILEQYFDLTLMGDHFGEVLDGFWLTIRLSVIAGILSLSWGLILAVLRQVPGKALLPVRLVTIAYIDTFRGIPLLMIIFLVSGGLGALASEGTLPQAIGIPQWLGLPDPFWYGVMAITISYGAYMAEVYRAGIEAVPHGQMDAARSLGMSHGQAMRYVIVPQAVRTVIPPLLNDFIALTKDTTLVSVIALNEVALVGRDIQAETFNSSAITLGALMFLVVTLPLARVVDILIARQQRKTERGGGAAPEAAPTPTGMAGS